MVATEFFFGEGLASFGRRLRAREFTAQDATQACLARIDALDGKLQAFVHVDREAALGAAHEIDRLLAAGPDLGPLMGVPVAAKDLYSVSGMPTTAGSRLDVSDLIEPEGGFIRGLRSAGCIILGKTRMTEFAMGGINLTHPTPWNPCDLEVHRMPGGSSSGSSVALAAGMCGFSIGSDTGGSVREPASLCGLVGYKATAGSWPMDGLFALSPTLDSIGWLAATADDAALIFAALRKSHVPAPRSARGLRLGRPTGRFFDDLDDAVGERTSAALAALERAGALIVAIDVPQLQELDDLAPIVAIELLDRLGAHRFKAGRDLMDPVPAARLAIANANDLPGLVHRHGAVRRAIAARMDGCDGWIFPTTPHCATPVRESLTLPGATAWNGRTFRNTRPANVFGQCAVSLPLSHDRDRLPIGLQLSCAAGTDQTLMAIARGLASVVSHAGPPPPGVSSRSQHQRPVL